MPDNWAFAWTKARGKYVTYLCDDDAIVPDTLSTIAHQALHGNPSIVTWEDATYFYPNWNDAGMRNILLLFNYGETVIEDLPSSVYRDLCAKFQFAWSSPIPKLLNCVVNREVVQGWREKLGALFFGTCPDYSIAWLASQLCDQIRVVHLPLAVRGISDYSIGSNAGMGEAAKQEFKAYGDRNLFTHSGLQIPLSINHIACTFLRANEALRKSGIDPFPINWDLFLLALAKQLREVEPLLPTWKDYIPELVTRAQQLSPETHDNVQSILTAPSVEPPTNPETITQLRDRTKREALGNPQHLIDRAKQFGGDRRCAGCNLGLEEGILADAQWDYLYLFGNDPSLSNIYGMSLIIGRYYALLTQCKEKRRQASLLENAQ